MADDGVKLSTKAEKTYAELIALGGVKVPVLKKDVNLYQLPIESLQAAAAIIAKRADDGTVAWTPTIGFNEYTFLENITSAMTSLIITCGEMPDNVYEYEFRFRFTTPAILGITTFQVKDSNGNPVTWIGTAPSLVGGKTYEVSVVKDLAIIGVSV